jgi:hypothetical protein
MTVYNRGIYLLVEISSTAKNAVTLPKNGEWERGWLGEMIFASPEKKVLSQTKEEK